MKAAYFSMNFRALSLFFGVGEKAIAMLFIFSSGRVLFYVIFDYVLLPEI